MRRRDFLHPKHLATAAGQAAEAISELTRPEETEASFEVTLLQLTRRAMATHFEILFPFGLPQAREAGDAAFDLIDELEAQMTVYRDNSEVSRINRLASIAPVQVEPQLFQLFQMAQAIYGETSGAFDISAGPLIKEWGFFKGPPRIPTPTERQQALQKVGMRHVRLDPQSSSIRYDRPGMEINLGSIGKGYALDRAAIVLKESWGIHCALLQGGNSSVLGIGCQPGERRGWAIGLRHPLSPEKRLGMVYLNNRAMGTSAATFKHLEYQGRRLGHILDPRTGWPAEGLAGVSVLAPTAAQADALATGLFILGLEKAIAFCKAHPEIGAVLIPLHEAPPVALNIREKEIEWGVETDSPIG